MSRRVYLLGAALALIGLALGFTDWALSLQPGVTERNVRRIRPGMTLGQAERFLGRPSDFCLRRCILLPSDGPVYSASGVLVWLNPHRAAQCRLDKWHADAGTVSVAFDAAGGVFFVRFEPRPRAARGPLARLRAWLGW